MTESEFLALAPRERDALVGKRVIGIPVADACREVYWEAAECHNPPDVWGMVRKFLPHFTTSISAAWTVVDGADGFSLDLNPHNLGYGKPIWQSHVIYYPTGEYIEAENRYEGEGFGTAYADTAPLAICLAALRAKGVIE